MVRREYRRIELAQPLRAARHGQEFERRRRAHAGIDDDDRPRDLSVHDGQHDVAVRVAPDFSVPRVVAGRARLDPSALERHDLAIEQLDAKDRRRRGGPRIEDAEVDDDAALAGHGRRRGRRGGGGRAGSEGRRRRKQQRQRVRRARRGRAEPRDDDDRHHPRACREPAHGPCASNAHATRAYGVYLRGTQDAGARIRREHGRSTARIGNLPPARRPGTCLQCYRCARCARRATSARWERRWSRRRLPAPRWRAAAPSSASCPRRSGHSPRRFPSASRR